jgi:hypothetical protein
VALAAEGGDAQLAAAQRAGFDTLLQRSVGVDRLMQELAQAP